jgi:peroxiredoxin
MSIKVGDKIPAATLRRMTDGGVEEVKTIDYFKGKKVVLFGVPGAFTPTCSKTHLPGYVSKADTIKARGINEIACLSVNDAFVMQAWGEAQGARGKVTMLADGSAEFSKAIGLDIDLTAKGLGLRCKRFSMLVEDGVVKKLEIEANPGEVTSSGADACLTGL